MMAQNFHLRWKLFSFLLLLSCSTGEVHRSLYYRNKNLDSFPKDILENVTTTHLTKATFSHNHLKVLRSSDFVVFSQFPNLKYVYFDHNDISVIEPNAFVHIPKLKHLALNHNKLTEITDVLLHEFTKLANLTHVDLRHNPIVNLDNIEELARMGVKVDYDGITAKNRLQKRGDELFEEHVSYVNESQSFDNGTFEKAFRVHDVDQKNTQSTGLSDKYYHSIMFNLFAGFLVLVVLPVVVVIYSCCGKDGRYS